MQMTEMTCLMVWGLRARKEMEVGAYTLVNESLMEKVVKRSTHGVRYFNRSLYKWNNTTVPVAWPLLYFGKDAWFDTHNVKIWFSRTP